MLKHAGMTMMVEDVSSVAPGDSVLIIRGDYLFDARVLHSLANSLNVVLEAPAKRYRFGSYVPEQGQAFIVQQVRRLAFPVAAPIG